MSNFAIDQLFMHGHFVSPAALVASGLLQEKDVKPGPDQAKRKVEATRKRDRARSRRWVHA
jgi:hypothetical protein